MGGDHADKAMTERFFAYKQLCDELRERGVVEVGNVYFEYKVDETAWENLFRHLGDQAPPWPFPDKTPKRDDLSEDMSPSYKQWRINRNLPVDTNQEEATNSTN
ncbi:hypothetical protein Forpi1262_v006900 [Fusarium oxysporum f. sp. raphani]|nr:hypothetical protein Forpi1262_v006900 [Fusarium oxysporum f. sp. raphani]